MAVISEELFKIYNENFKTVHEEPKNDVTNETAFELDNKNETVDTNQTIENLKGEIAQLREMLSGLNAPNGKENKENEC